MSLRSILLLALLGVGLTSGCSAPPRFALHSVGRGVELARLQELHTRYARPILVLGGEVFVPDWGCVCAKSLLSEGVELVDPQGARLMEEKLPESEAGSDARLRLACFREEQDDGVFRVEGEFTDTLYLFDGRRLRPASSRVIPIEAPPEPARPDVRRRR